MKPGAVLQTALLAVIAALLGVLASWPVYETPRLWLVAAVAVILTGATVVLGTRLRWHPVSVFTALLGIFVVSVVPLAVPSAFDSGLAALPRALGDALASVVLGWKQLLTLTLPVGSYQTVLVPFLVVVMLSVALICGFGLRGGRLAPFAAIPMLLPLVFGTTFGASEVSGTVSFGPLRVEAPRELLLWITAAVIGAVWVAWTSSAERRLALRRGRLAADETEERVGRAARRRSALSRGAGGLIALVAALALGVSLAPVATVADRTVPRDRIDPEIVVSEQTSPLAGYREWKRDASFEAPLFTVDAEGKLPARLRIAVLEGYDGIDFTASESAGRFARFPSGSLTSDTSEVSIAIESGYTGIWVPLATPLASPPRFGGERAAELADSFYLNRDTGAAVAVPTRAGLRAGDSFTAEMSVAGDAAVSDRPQEGGSLIDLESVPQLADWLTAQDLPESGEGLTEAIQRLRDRGYLSHSITDAEGERAWIEALTDEYGLQFISSTGGHSLARVEQLFEQLNEQQRVAGEDADSDELVAGIGDDEQFATAAALVARAMGFESRVVLGVRLGGEDAGVEGLPACSSTCSGQHITAWIEVRGADQQWSALDVSPQVSVRPTTLEQNEQLPEHETVPEEQDASESDPPLGMSDQDDGESDEEEDSQFAALWRILRYVALGIAALALLALPLLFIPIAKRIRRRRRRASAPAEVRALGAWDELIDRSADMRLLDAARARSRTASRRDLATELGGGRALQLADLADRAVFASESVPAESVDAAWHAVDEERRERAAGLGAWARLRAAYSFASLRPIADRRRVSSRAAAVWTAMRNGAER